MDEQKPPRSAARTPIPGTPLAESSSNFARQLSVPSRMSLRIPTVIVPPTLQRIATPTQIQPAETAGTIMSGSLHSKKKLRELVAQIDPEEKLEPDAEDVQLVINGS